MEYKKIYNDTYCITDIGNAGAVCMYLLVGSERALLIDSGYGGVDLRKLIAEITDKPVTVVLTHGHLDHALGAYMFDEAYLHSSDMRVFEEHSSLSFLKRDFENYKRPKHPKNRFELPIERIINANRPLPNILESKKVFELGDRTVSWINTPGHTNGCCCFIDETYKTVFTGDFLSRGVWMQFKESSTLEEYKNSLLRLKNCLDEKGIVNMYTAHDGKRNANKLVTNMCKLIDAILAGKCRSFNYKNKIAPGRLYLKHGCAIVIKNKYET